MPTQIADNADSLSDNPDDHLHAPPVYNGLFDPRSKVGGLAKRFFDVACHGAPACEPKRARTIPFPEDKMCTYPPKPGGPVAAAIETLNATRLPAPATSKPDAPPQGEGGTERPLARCPFPQRRKEVSEARGPSLYVGDCTLKAWFAGWREGNQAGGATRQTWWTEGGHQQVCVMWPRLSLGNNRIPEEALIEALRDFPESMEVMWMLTPTVRGTNMAAMQQEYSDEKRYPAMLRWSQGKKVWKCLEKPIGFKNGTPFMHFGLNGMWGPTIMDVLWSNEDWLTLETGLTDPCHPSETGLNKYKKLAWDAMGRNDLLSIKIIDGWHFQENTDCSFECYAREMRMLLQTRYVGHAIDVLQMMLRYPKKSVPLGKTCSLRELTGATRWIPPPGLNPDTVTELSLIHI